MAMSGTFACPHCGATYPRKPVLVGRAVRCTTCKNAFRLREDGIADMIEMPAPGAASATVPTPTVQPDPPVQAQPESPPASIPPIPVRIIQAPPPTQSLDLTPSNAHPLLPAQKPPSTSTALPTASQTSGGRSVRLTAQQLQARRSMAATLTSSITAALKSDSVNSEAKEERKNRTTRAAKTKEGENSVGAIGPAVLSGAGDQESKAKRKMLLGCLTVVVVVVAAAWFLLQTSLEQQAIEDFCIIQPSRIKTTGDRYSAIQSNAWFIALPPSGLGVIPLVDLGKVRIQKPQILNLAAGSHVFSELLKGLEPLSDGSAWVTPAMSGEKEETKQDKTPTGKKNEVPAKTVAKRMVLRKEVEAALSKAGFDKDDLEVVMMILLGRTAIDGSNDIAQRLRSGSLPLKTELVTFTGRDGAILLRGQNKSLRTDYEGKLLRFHGEGWPLDWKVLVITTANTR